MDENIKVELVAQPYDKCLDVDTMQLRILHLEEYNKILLQKIEQLEVHLAKYTNGDNHKRYYEKNKNKIKESGTAYLQKLKTSNPEKLKEYSRNAYERKKLKKKMEDDLNKLKAEEALFNQSDNNVVA